MKRLLFLAMVLVAVVSSVGVALAQLPLPQSLAGTVTKSGGGPAPDGALIYATVDDYTSPKTSDARVKDGKYFITLGPPSSGYSGKTVRLWVDEDRDGPLPPVEARTTGAIVFQPNTYNLDLNITYAPPTPPTPTPTATPRATETPRSGPTPTPTLPAAGTKDLFYLALVAAVFGVASVLGGAWAWRRGRARA